MFAKNADNVVDGLKIIDGKVLGKIPLEDFKAIRTKSIQNPNSDIMTLGKYTSGSDSYTKMAGDTTYFNLGDEWAEIQKTYDLSDDDMFDIFNVPALDDAVSSGKKIRFSHDPENPKNATGAFKKEWEYLKNKHGYSEAIKEGDFWYATK